MIKLEDSLKKIKNILIENNINSSKDVLTSKKLENQIIGQNRALELAKMAAKYRKNLLLIGPPGTGKSLIGKMVNENLKNTNSKYDYIIHDNFEDPNLPKIVKVEKTFDYKNYKKKFLIYSKDNELVKSSFKFYRMLKNIFNQIMYFFKTNSFIIKIKRYFSIYISYLIYSAIFNYIRMKLGLLTLQNNVFNSDIQKSIYLVYVKNKVILKILFDLILLFKTILVNLLVIIGQIYLYVLINAVLYSMFMRRRHNVKTENNNPNIPDLVYGKYILRTKDYGGFVNASAASSDALTGSISHNALGFSFIRPYTLVKPGLIHKANNGILYIDELGLFNLEKQYKILTAMEDKELPISGSRNSGTSSNVITDPLPCNFSLIIAGNNETVKNIHPAIRSRITGNGYEVYMESTCDLTEKNILNYVKFFKQEVLKNGDYELTMDAILELFRISFLKTKDIRKLTLLLRQFSGLIKISSDLVEPNRNIINSEHIKKSYFYSETLEDQITGRMIKKYKEYKPLTHKKGEIGIINGISVLSISKSKEPSIGSGLVMKIICRKVKKHNQGKDIFKKGNIVPAVELKDDSSKGCFKIISALVTNYLDIGSDDVYVQFSSYSVNGDSAGAGIFLGIFSAIYSIPLKTDFAITGAINLDLSVSAVGGIFIKTDAVLQNTHLKKVLIPKINYKEISYKFSDSLKIICIEKIQDTINHVFYKKDLKSVKKIFKNFNAK